jgi:hypothetical protein
MNKIYGEASGVINYRPYETIIEDLTPKQYRLVKRYIEGDFFEYVLQGNFFWRNEQGGGNEWRDLETIEERIEK